MSKIIHYLDSQSDICLLADAQLYYQEIRTTDLLFLLQGKAELVVDGKKSVMKKDDIIVINKQESYKLLAEEGSLLFHFSISQYLLSQALEVEREGFYCNSIEQPNRNYQSIRQSIISIIDLLLFENDKTNFLHISKIYHLLNELSSLFLEKTIESFEEDQRIQKITRVIKEQYYDNLSLSQMATLVHMDVAYFSKFFKKNLGINFKDYLSNVRMQHAVRDLLETEKPITQIAIDNGFFSVNGFNKKFKERYNTSPSVYRKNYRVKEKAPAVLVSEEIKDTFSRYKKQQQRPVISNQTFRQYEISGENREPIKTSWANILNVGEAKFVLNSKLRQQLSAIQQNLKFKYGRIWALLTPELLGESLSRYDTIDEIIDSLVILGLTPWITINKISRGFKESEYPREKWRNLIHDFCLHLLNRYGSQAVSQWKIEIVASAPEDVESAKRYRTFYQLTSSICKTLLPETAIGGGTFIVTNDLKIEELLNGCLADCCFDFYSFALFPYSNRLVREKRNYQRVTDPDFLKNQVQRLKKSDLIRPIYISEWSSTVSRSNRLNDTLYKGTFIVKSLIDIFDQVDGLGYWLSTDLAQKNTHYHGLLTGGNGLVTKNGLLKPAMHAMKFFDQLRGTYFQTKDDRHLVCASEENEYFILGHYYVHPNNLYFLKDESHLKLTEIEQFFEASDHEEELVLTNIPNGRYELRVFSCLAAHGDLFTQWAKLNFIRELRGSDIKYLEAKSTHLQTLDEIEVTNNRIVIQKHLETNEFYEINIRKRQ